jgi:hypothetical protein
VGGVVVRVVGGGDVAVVRDTTVVVVCFGPVVVVEPPGAVVDVVEDVVVVELSIVIATWPSVLVPSDDGCSKESTGAPDSACSMYRRKKSVGRDPPVTCGRP